METRGFEISFATCRQPGNRSEHIHVERVGVLRSKKRG